MYAERADSRCMVAAEFRPAVRAHVFTKNAFRRHLTRVTRAR